MLCLEKAVPLSPETVTEITNILWRPSNKTIAFSIVGRMDHGKLPIVFSVAGGKKKIAHTVASEDDALILALSLIAIAGGKVLVHTEQEKALVCARDVAKTRGLLEKKCPSFVSCNVPSYVNIIINAVEQCTGILFNFCEITPSHDGSGDLSLSANVEGCPL